MQTYIEDKELGRVHVELRRSMRSIRFSIKPDGTPLIKAPVGISTVILKRFLDENREKLRKLHTPVSPDFYFGQEIPCYQCKVVIQSQNYRPGYCMGQWDEEVNVLHVSVDESMDLKDYAVKKLISYVIGDLMTSQAVKSLLPYASKVADSLGLKPTRFEVGRGMRKLGHCTTRNVIQLSRNLLFMPQELIRYIICHELAHMTHHDHSPQFHALCNQYTGGKEKELEQQLRQFKWPIVR